MPSTTPFRLFDTLTGRVKELRPLEAGHLRMYGCGPTVYSYAHIGNFRSFLTADLIVRTAHALGWQTTYVTNITDVGHLTTDDTIDPGGEDRMARAINSKEGQRFVNVWDLARYYTDTFVEDWERLNLLEPFVRPRAIEHIGEQIRAIEELIRVGAAYESPTGVYFSVPSFASYGKLSGNDTPAQLRHAVREVVVDDHKRDSRDFALWKKDPHHLMQWHSPWGWGFPGWHIECSVMAQTYLGEQIDLHTGGEDLIFPHHECEIAQAESLTNQPFARHWVHTRFLQVEGQKMSKRLGNFLRVRDVLEEDAPLEKALALRLALISGQYRKPFNYTSSTFKDSLRHVQRFREAHERAGQPSTSDDAGTSTLSTDLETHYTRALAAMANDLNSPAAIAAALAGTKCILELPSPLSMTAATHARTFLERIEALLGIVGPAPGEAATPSHGTESRTAGLADIVEPLIKAREEARARKDWSQADALRDEILSHNVELRDTPEGTTWKPKITL